MKNRRVVEQEVFDTLENLAALYGFKPLAKCNAVYPHNIARAFRHAAHHVSMQCSDTSLAIIKDDMHTATVVSYQQYPVGQMLYYVPVKQLWQLMQDSSRKPQSELLLSVFAYLSQIVELPMYTEPRSYLSYQYEMVVEWYSEDDEVSPEDYEEMRAEYYHLQKTGKLLHRELCDAVNISLFEQRLNSFKPVSETDLALKDIVQRFYNLYTDYPAQSIFDCIPQGFDEPQQQERINAWQYLSFIWDIDSQITCDLFTAINAELQEYGVMDCPVSVQYFDQPQTCITMSLEFPQRFFALIDDLADLLKTF